MQSCSLNGGFLAARGPAGSVVGGGRSARAAPPGRGGARVVCMAGKKKKKGRRGNTMEQVPMGDKSAGFACLPEFEGWTTTLTEPEPETSWPELEPRVLSNDDASTSRPARGLADVKPKGSFQVEDDDKEGEGERADVVYADGGDDEWDDWDEELDGPRPTGPRNKIPAIMRCFDRADILVKGGTGGAGCVAFRREKFVPLGGPAGGNGGNGGAVWAEVDASLNSLMFFRRQVHFRAADGKPGEGKDCHGATAQDLTIKVPPGTIFRMKDADETDPPVAELLDVGDRALLSPGGRGGRGNASFKTKDNNCPRISERGEEMPETWLKVELNLVADVGIIGVPNAGKSTLLSVLSAARPKIANYPFTTLVPNLGVCEMDYRATVFADVPGLLEGAHTGHGLGHEFLRHCQRCRALVHVIDGTSRDPFYDFRAIKAELELFDPELADKPFVVAYNKVDVPDSGDYYDDIREMLRGEGVADEDIIDISAVTGHNVAPLVRRVRAVLDELPDEGIKKMTDAVNTIEKPKKFDPTKRIDQYTVERDGSAGYNVWYVEGEALERFAQMTNWDYFEAVKRFQKALEASGVSKRLRKMGVAEGDTVCIGELEFLWSDDQSEGALYENWSEAAKEAGRYIPHT